MPKIEQEVWSMVKYIGFVFALCAFVALIQQELQLSRIEFLGTFTIISISLLMIVIWSGFSGLGKEMHGEFEEVKKLLQKQGSVKDPSEEVEAKTSGAGAFGGMVVGGLLGLLLGPVGVVIGGAGGALIGDLIERENIRTERERRRRQS